MAEALKDVKNGFKMTELGPLPEDWDVLKLKNVADIIMGQSPPGKTYNKKGKGMPFLQGKSEFGLKNPYHLKYTTKPLKIAPQGSILISVRAPVGDVNLADIDYCIGRGLASIFSKTQINVFLYFLFTYLKPILEKQGTGSTFKAINKGKLSDFLVPIPSFPEQQAIAHILSTIQSVIEATDQVIIAAQELKKSLMKHLFTYGPAPVGEKERITLKETQVGLMPDHWKEVCLENLLTKTQYGLSKRGNKDGTHPILRMNNLSEGKVFTKDLQYVELEENEFKKFKLDKCDLLFNRTNSYDLVGKVSLFDIMEEAYVFASYLIRLKVSTAKLSPYFLNMYLNWEFTQHRLKMLASRGASQSNISATKIKGFSISLPPISEQNEIAKVLLAIDNKIDYESKNIACLQSLFNSMLHHLMTGKLRVKDIDFENLGVPSE